jgi:hypothetical protein
MKISNHLISCLAVLWVRIRPRLDLCRIWFAYPRDAAVLGFVQLQVSSSKQVPFEDKVDLVLLCAGWFRNHLCTSSPDCACMFARVVSS